MRPYAIVAILLTLFFLPLPPSAQAEIPKAVAFASASGSALILQRNMLQSPLTVVSYGSGRIIVDAQGLAEQRVGYYSFGPLQLALGLRAWWTTSQGVPYLLEARIVVPFSSHERGVVQGDAHPDVAAFIIFSADFDGSVIEGDVRVPVEGTAKIWALTPETSFQPVEGKYLAVRLIMSSPAPLGIMEFTLGWSEIAQTVGGLSMARADHYSQSVRLILSNS